MEKLNLKHLIGIIHLKVFKQPIGEEMQKFINNIGIMSFGTLSGAILLFITNIIAGRLLGPTEYGKYSLVISLGQIFIIPMLLGLSTASTQHISSSSTTQHKKDFAQSSFFLSIVSILITTFVAIILKDHLSIYLKIDSQIFAFLLIYSVILAFKYTAEAIIKGFHQFKLLALLEILNTTTIFVSFFIILYTSHNHDYTSYLVPILLGLTTYLTVFLSKHISLFRFHRPNKKMVSTLLNYSKFVFLGGIAGIAISNIDKFIVNKYLSLADVGLYSIYLSSSSFIGSYMLQIFVQVFFPTVSSIIDKKSITIKIGKLMLISALPIIIVNLLSTSAILYLVGSQYQKNLTYIVLFSLLGMITFFSNIFWWLIASYGKSGIKFTSYMGIIIGFLNILTMVFLVQVWSIIGVVTTLIATNLLMIIVSVYKIYFHDHQ